MFAKQSVEAFYFWDTKFLLNGRKPTSIYTRLHNLIKQQWMTHTTVTTDGDGYLSFRGFRGDYNLRLNRAQAQSGYKAHLGAGTITDQQQIMVDFLGNA